MVPGRGSGSMQGKKPVIIGVNAFCLKKRYVSSLTPKKLMNFVVYTLHTTSDCTIKTNHMAQHAAL